MKKLFSTLALAAVFSGCSSTQGTTKPFAKDSSAVILNTKKNAA